MSIPSPNPNKTLRVVTQGVELRDANGVLLERHIKRPDGGRDIYGDHDAISPQQWADFMPPAEVSIYGLGFTAAEMLVDRRVYFTTLAVKLSGDPVTLTSIKVNGFEILAEPLALMDDAAFHEVILVEDLPIDGFIVLLENSLIEAGFDEIGNVADFQLKFAA
jgi:hypothetical protein